MLSLALVATTCGGGGDEKAHVPTERLRAGDAAVLIAAAGDIAQEGEPSDANIQTAALIVELAPDAVLALGDNQYEDGTLAEYRASYDLSWSEFKDKTYPVPGNHDYHTEGAQGYFDYFGDVAAPPGGYYSFDLGEWHLVAVNAGDGVVSHEQLTWLRSDLRADHHLCELAYWHQPRWSSASVHGSDAAMAPVWNLMVRQGVDVVLNGHDHVYERFAKLDAGGEPDRRGAREFIAGTGGESLYGFDEALTGSQVRLVEFGVLTLLLRKESYGWAFLGATNRMVLDEGSTPCHE